MHTQRDNPSLRWSLSLLLLLGLALPLAISQTRSYREAVLRAVDEFNRQSSDTNLYRLLDLESQPAGDEDPDTPKYVRFRVKETVCDKALQQLPEQCNFKEHGLVKQCVGTVTLSQDTDSFDINCKEPGTQPQKFKKIAKIAGLLRKGGQKIGEKIKKIGQKIADLFGKTAPEAEK
ncbi:cathelicidin antimicrobial peptide [Peromyscus californicus insignis]|uniref:cathelicidin antimicrobial peptide n=1 Tax=Peromyscus californicus insignis TaxID=564181 RepID=UPI0022A74F8A|nr:cathelicidin antimicrobial peptide [Peromyscus californicus insignis]